MKFFQMHVGDYAEATMHLTLLEDGVYWRLIRKYYATEKPLPADIKAVCRLVVARSGAEKKAVETVLNEFFTLLEDGWHNARCDEEISSYREGDAEREQKTSHEKERMSRFREERSRLFAELRELGITPKWDTPVTQLREILQRTCNAPATHQEQTCNAPVTAISKPITNNHEPITTLSSVTGNDKSSAPVTLPATHQEQTCNATEQQTTTTRNGLLSRQLRKIGIDAAPHMQVWAEILPNFTDDEIIGAAQSAREKKPGERISLAYLLPMLQDKNKPTRRTQKKTFAPTADDFSQIDYGKGGSF